MGEVVDIQAQWLDEETGEIHDRSQRPRYISRRGEEKEHVNIKVPTRLVRLIDEYVASRIDPYCKTRSDAINDAILAWTVIVRDKSSEVVSLMAIDIELAYSTYEQDHFEDILENSEKEIDRAVKDQNTLRLESMLKALKASKPTFEKKCGKVKIEQLDKMIRRLEETLNLR